MTARAPGAAGRVRRWRPTWRCDPGRQFGDLRRGTGDPTYRVVDRVHWRALRTPEGPVTLSVERTGPEIRGEAWGPGAQWALDTLPRALGDEDDPDEFDPRGHPALLESARRYGLPRFGATGRVMEALVPAIIEQKVTGQEAFAGFRRLVRRYGEPAPGPGGELDLWLQPDPTAMRRLPSWVWLRLPVDPARSRAVVTACRVADSLERTIGLPGDEVERRLTSLRGIGEWTAAEVRQKAHGDPDAVSFGDYHVAKDVGWALTGEQWSDDRLREFLEPFRGQRNRVVSLVYAAAGHRPRRGPRMPPRTHLPA